MDESANMNSVPLNVLEEIIRQMTPLSTNNFNLESVETNLLPHCNSVSSIKTEDGNSDIMETLSHRNSTDTTATGSTEGIDNLSNNNNNNNNNLLYDHLLFNENLSCDEKALFDPYSSLYGTNTSDDGVYLTATPSQLYLTPKNEILNNFSNQDYIHYNCNNQYYKSLKNESKNNFSKINKISNKNLNYFKNSNNKMMLLEAESEHFINVEQLSEFENISTPKAIFEVKCIKKSDIEYIEKDIKNESNDDLIKNVEYIENNSPKDILDTPDSNISLNNNDNDYDDDYYDNDDIIPENCLPNVCKSIMDMSKLEEASHICDGCFEISKVSYGCSKQIIKQLPNVKIYKEYNTPNEYNLEFARIHGDSEYVYIESEAKTGYEPHVKRYSTEIQYNAKGKRMKRDYPSLCPYCKISESKKFDSLFYERNNSCYRGHLINTHGVNSKGDVVKVPNSGFVCYKQSKNGWSKTVGFKCPYNSCDTCFLKGDKAHGFHEYIRHWNKVHLE
ncbi:hypothetical protein C6P42_002906 [Pichia californica]|nr:hypothetical protein C6P42_002906 [[Candida] californica]